MDLDEQCNHKVHQSKPDYRYNIQGLPTEFFAEGSSYEWYHSETQAIQAKTKSSLELSAVEIPYHGWPSKVIGGRSSSFKFTINTMVVANKGIHPTGQCGKYTGS